MLCTWNCQLCLNRDRQEGREEREGNDDREKDKVSIQSIKTTENTATDVPRHQITHVQCR